MPETRWRAFYGDWDPDPDPMHDWVYLDGRGLMWEEARLLLAAKLERWEDDSCAHCRHDGMEALTRLRAAEPGTRFEASVAGDDYVIVPDDDAPTPPEVSVQGEPAPAKQVLVVCEPGDAPDLRRRIDERGVGDEATVVESLHVPAGTVYVIDQPDLRTILRRMRMD